MTDELFWTLFANSLDAMVMTDDKGRYVEVNQAACDLLGFSRKRILRMSVQDLITTSDLSAAEQFQQYLLHGRQAGEFAFIRADTEPRIVSYTACRLAADRHLSILRDITAQKQAENALAISEGRARRLFDANVIGIIHWNLDTGRITDANDLFLKMVGYTREDLAAGLLNWKEMTPPEWRERNDEGVEEIRHRRSGSPYEKEYFRKDGSRLPILIGGALFEDSANEGASLILDISQQKQAENALRASEERYRVLAFATAQVIWSTDASGANVKPMESWGQFTGQTQEEYAGWGWLKAIHPKDRPHVRDVWEKCVQAQTLYECEYRLRHRDGRYRNALARGVPLTDEAGQVREWIGTTTDITERVQYLHEIQALNARLQRSIRETHHRVKNNLQIISALVEVQIEDSADTVPVAAMTRIGLHTRSLAAIHDLLTRQAAANAHTNVLSSQGVLDDLLPLLQANTGGRPIRYEAVDVILPVGAVTALTLLVSEIVSNAVKHGRGDIEVTLTADRGLVRLEVCDDGPGFPPDFDWHTASNTGLSLIDSTARYDLRGSVSYENRSQGGGRVVVTFPISLPTEDSETY